MFEKFLEELGLSEKEAKIYVALLQYDSATINEIAKKTGVNRTTVYPVLESLQKKGLVSEIQDGKKTEYHAEPPERLETYLERQKVVLQEQSERLKKDIVPQLKSIQRELGERPVVKLYQGREGALVAYDEFYQLHKKSPRNGFFVYNIDLLESLFTKEEQDRFRAIRFGKEVYPYSLYNFSKDKKFATKGKRIKLDETKYPILADITIIDDQIIASTLQGETVSVLIKSKDIAVTLTSIMRYIHDQN